MTAPTNAGTQVAKREENAGLDVYSEKASRRFLEAFSAGKLDRLPQEKQEAFLMALGQRLGVHAELGELILYQGRPYITRDGRVRIAHETGLMDGVVPRPASHVERRDYGAEEGDILWVADCYKKGCRKPFRGWGCVTAAERAALNSRGERKNTPVQNNPREMARKRAEYDALRLAFPADEQIGALHLQYAEEAEEEAARIAPPTETRVRTVTESEYGGGEEIALSPAQHAAAADAGEEEDWQDDRDFDDSGELPLGETRRTRNAVEEGR